MSVALLGVQPSSVLRRVTSAKAPAVAASIAFWYCSTPAGEIDTVAALTLASFALIRPIAKRHMYTPPRIRTGAAALIGTSGIVLDRIANDEGVGSVRLDGEVWTARAYDDHVVIEAGTKVEVVEIRGATALVTP